MSLTNEEYKKYDIPKEKKSHKGLDRVAHLAMGKIYKQTILLKKLYQKAKMIHTNAKEYVHLSEDELDKKILNHQKKIRLNRYSDEDIYEAISCICEVCYRTLGMRPYYEQIMGVLGQYYNFAIQMLPGEGKTVTACMSGVVFGWSGKPCHIVTSNDYLAQRDAKIVQKLYNRCNLSVGYIVGSMKEDERIENYKKNIVYSTSKELLADFLRDQIVDKSLNDYDNALLDKLLENRQNKNPKKRVMRGLYTAIVDEADSVLVDEAITPLVISQESENKVLKDAILLANSIVDRFQNGIHYTSSQRHKEITFTNEGETLIDELSSEFPSIWQTYERKKFLIVQVLLAREFYHKGKQYIIDEENKIVLVDEKTGRLMIGKNWNAGLHQAVEAKENLELSNPTQTDIKMSFQRFFRLYKNLSGMSGTLQNIEAELWSIYELAVIYIPKRVDNTYTLHPLQIYKTLQQKQDSIIDTIIDIHKTKRPILVGTTSINESEYLANILQSLELKAVVLNAKQYKIEDEIVSKAGEMGSITIATNIAGRGTDIKISDEIESLGGLYVIATQLSESKRVDLQLFGRTSRQGQKGDVKVFLSLEDELMQKNFSRWFLKIVSKYFSYTKSFCILLYKYGQRKLEKKVSKRRVKVLEEDFEFDEKISFSV
jgi:preprotein translocase subunit SecA